MNTLKLIGALILVLLIIDFLGAIAWIASNQQPQGTFYIGTLTLHLLRVIVK
jgi:hypothetical protein